MKVENQDKLYIVVQENEDDPYCSHWDDTVLITPNFSVAKDFCRNCILQNKKRDYWPRIQEHSYDSKSKMFNYVKEYGMFGNGTMTCLNYDEVKTALKSLKGKCKIGTQVIVRYKISTNDVFLGEVIKEFESRYYIGQIDDSLPPPHYWIWSDVFSIENEKKIFLGTNKFVTTIECLNEWIETREHDIISGYSYVAEQIAARIKEMKEKGEI